MKIREDKTLSYKMGRINGTANNIYIACDIFMNTFKPVLFSNINSKDNLVNLYNDIIDNNKYYSFKQNSESRNMLQKFHNDIKRSLINKVVKNLSKQFKKIKCLDYGIGQGGDLIKYIDTNYNNNNNNKL